MAHVHFKQKKLEFKEPKITDFSPTVNRNNGLFSSPRRPLPQPSPSKSQILLKELGLDSSDTNLDDSSSSEDDSSDEVNEVPSIIEYNAMQHELEVRNKERENLLMRNHDFEEKLNDYKRRLHREQMKTKSQLKIISRTNEDVVKDKETLIGNLQDIITENESKIDQLESEIKGTPFHLSEPKSSNIHKLVESIKNLHNEKSSLHKQVLNLEQRLEEKEADFISLQESKAFKNGSRDMNKSKTDSEKVVAKLQEEIVGLKKHINNYEDNKDELLQADDRVENLKEEIENLQQKIETIEDKLKKSERKHRSEISKLEKEIEKKTVKIDELKNQKPEVVTNTVEKIVEIESRSLRNDYNDALDKIKKLEKTNKDVEIVIAKREDENEKLQKEIQSLKIDMSSSAHDVEELTTCYEEKKNLLQSELAQLKADLAREKRNTEKAKGHVAKEKAKVNKLELEFQEMKASLHHIREELAQEREIIETEIQERENEMTKEIEQIKESFERDRKENEKNIERLEKKVIKSNEKLRRLQVDCEEFEKKVTDKNKQIDKLHDEIVSLEEAASAHKQSLHDAKSECMMEQQRYSDLQKQLENSKQEVKLFHHQVEVLSGASDVASTALTEKDKENKHLREQIVALNNELREVNSKLSNTQNDHSTSISEVEKLNCKISALKSHHQIEFEKLRMEHEDKINHVQKIAEKSQHTIASKNLKLQTHLRHIIPIIRSLKHDNQQLKKDCAKFPIMIEDAAHFSAKQINEAISELNDNNAEMVRRYVKEMKLRKKYHNELVELKGNIRVFVRVRPKISEDGNGPMAKSTVSFDASDDGMMFVHNNQRGRSQMFELDKVFQPASTQQEVYDEVQSLVISCIDGYHVCIFAYGQTGSGKTYTMEGSSSDPGINQRALRDLFSEIDSKAKDWSYTVTVSLVEIYNETLRDLLNSRVEKLDIKMNGDGSLYVSNLKDVEVQSIGDVNELFSLGKRNRSTASTNMNEHSSRSHAVLVINVRGVNQTTGAKTFGKLNLIDLAGSERVSKSGASGDRLEEAKNINRSLSAIGDVIHALRGKSSHVPFRNSKLTYMLQDSLSKDSKTLMVVQVSPVEKNVSETICSLSFAQRVRSVELGQASKKTEDPRIEDTPQKRSGIAKLSTPMKRK